MLSRHGEHESEIENGLVGKVVTKASSSLTMFALEIDGKQGVVIEAVREAAEPQIVLCLVEAGQLPVLDDTICKVDWSWICGCQIKEASTSRTCLKLNLDPAGPLSISALMWHEGPFLAFKPFKPLG